MSSRAADFFKSTVKPTVEEFMASPLNIRLGRLSAILLSHMTDYWALEGYAGKDRKEMDNLVRGLRKELSDEYPDYSFVVDIADASKHALLAVPKNGSRELYSSEQITRTQGLFDAPFGEGYFAEACMVFANLEDGTRKPIYDAILSVLKMWEGKLNAVI